MSRHLVLPDEAPVVNVFGSDRPKKRAYRARLKRAEKSGLLPPRVYLSCQRFGYWSDELEAALSSLPTSYTATLGSP